MRTRIRSPRHLRERGLGGLAVAWVEYFCVHGPGDVEGTPLDPELPDSLPLDDEFAGFIADSYALTDKGRRLYHSAFISRAKGRAKSELAGFIALFEALGPCRFAGWARGGETFTAGDFVYHYEPGEAMGRPVTSPIIRCLATEEGQAGNTYDNVYLNLGGYGEELGSSRLIAAYGIRLSDVNLGGISLPGGSGEVVPSSASSSSKDGGKETFVVFDETHLYTTPELHRLYGTVTRNLGKRKDAEPWALETSTMYAPGENSIAEQTHAVARSIQEGKAKIDYVLFDHRQADPNTNLGDIESIKVGLREAYGAAAAWTDIDRKAASFFDKRNTVADLRRYSLNMPTSASDAWLTSPDVDAVTVEGVDVEPKETITLGFDGSEKRTGRGRIADATALIACRVSDAYIWPIEVWEQPEGPDGDDWSVDVEAVKDAVDGAFSAYDVVGFYADPPKWEGVVSEWENAYTERLRVKASPRGAVTWWTNRTTLMGRALDAFENAVRDRELTLAPGVLVRHLLNARRRPRREAMAIGKDHPKSRRKIDAAMAAVLAYQARADFLASGQKSKRRKFRAVTVRR